MYNSYISNGVILTPNVVTQGDKATIKYKGLLHNAGAHSVFMRMGYGINWDNTKDIRMTRTDDGYEAEVDVSSNQKLNLAFKDCANNWDNNSNMNYSFDVELR